MKRENIALICLIVLLVLCFSFIKFIEDDYLANRIVTITTRDIMCEDVIGNTIYIHWCGMESAYDYEGLFAYFKRKYLEDEGV